MYETWYFQMFTIANFDKFSTVCGHSVDCKILLYILHKHQNGAADAYAINHLLSGLCFADCGTSRLFRNFLSEAAARASDRNNGKIEANAIIVLWLHLAHISKTFPKEDFIKVENLTHSNNLMNALIKVLVRNKVI